MRFLPILARPALAIAFATALAPRADAGTSLLHAGMNDPTTEGFLRALGGADPGPSPGNDGEDYWEIDTTDPATTFWTYTIPELSSTLSSILASGNPWMLSVTVRVLEASGGGLPAVTVSDPFVGPTNDTWHFAFVLNSGNPGQSSLSFLSSANQLIPITTLDVSEYHDYEFELDPGANPAGFDDSLEVRVDGAVVGTLARTSVFDQNVGQRFSFGETSAAAGAGSRSRWARVELMAVPEPGRPLLLLVAAAALRFARRPRSPAHSVSPIQSGPWAWVSYSCIRSR